MIVLKELGMSLFLGIAIAGILTVLFINNPKTWYEAAKKVENKRKFNKNKVSEEIIE